MDPVLKFDLLVIGLMAWDHIAGHPSARLAEWLKQSARRRPSPPPPLLVDTGALIDHLAKRRSPLARDHSAPATAASDALAFDHNGSPAPVTGCINDFPAQGILEIELQARSSCTIAAIVVYCHLGVFCYACPAPKTLVIEDLFVASVLHEDIKKMGRDDNEAELRELIMLVRSGLSSRSGSIAGIRGVIS